MRRGARTASPPRTNLYRYNPKTNAFMVTIFYPAETPAAGALPDSMWPRRIASDPGVYSMLGSRALALPRVIRGPEGGGQSRIGSGAACDTEAGKELACFAL